MSYIRLGIIGPGLIWKQRHEPVLRTLSDVFIIAAFCDSTENMRTAIAQQYPGAPFMTNYQDFVKREDIDAVIVLTPIPLNAPVAIAALEAGKHVFMEKPMACSLQEAEDLLASAERSGKRLIILEQDGFDLRWQRLREVIESGEIGEVVSYDMVNHSRFDDLHTKDAYAKTNWRKEANFPLGRLFDGGHHKLALVAVVLGQPEAIFASAVKLRPNFGEYDHIVSHIHYQSGVRGYFSYAGYLPKQRNYLYLRGTKGLISVEEDSNTLRIEYEEGLSRSMELPSESAHVTMWREIAQFVTQGGSISYTPHDALRELTTLIRIDSSIKTGQPATF